MASGDVVRLVNEGDTDFKDAYGSRPYVIPAGEQMFVEFDAMCLWLGHPDATDFDPRNRVRTAEYQRLRGRYGVDARDLERTLSGHPGDVDELFTSLRPRLAAYTPEGERIITVSDDPTGDTLSPTAPITGDNSQLILARMAQLEAEITNLRAQAANANAREQALNDAQPITTDNPDLTDPSIAVGGTGIPGTITPSADAPTTINPSAPRPQPRTTPGEDTPTRVRVSG